jgi:Flp pilus assembly protein TadG
VERRRRARDERGTSLVEFALILPVLVLFIFGIIDFGWAFSQQLSLKHAAREGVRAAVVNNGAAALTNAQLKALIVSRSNGVDLAPADSHIYLSRTDSNGDGRADAGDLARVEVCVPLQSVSGVSSRFLSGTLRATVEMRVEQDVTWSTDTGADPCA